MTINRRTKGTTLHCSAALMSPKQLLYNFTANRAGLRFHQNNTFLKVL